ncbi:MAG: hypothetical protein QM541_11410 [Flavobacterium sp.]|nr:hypothetical protein [Flavobacterium sp.]
MKLILFSALSLTTVIGFAQQSFALKLARENRLNNLSINKPFDNMPLVNVSPNGQTFLYNNGNGLNIYKSQPDNMPVVKPDGYYFDNMGIKRIASKTIADVINNFKSNHIQTDGNSKFNFVFPSKKDIIDFVDSVKTLQLKPNF